jgi:hypothetical protein
MNIRFAIAALLFCWLPLAGAQEMKDTQIKAQKKAAEENLKKAELTKIISVESAEIMLYTSLPEARAKTIVAGAQKAFDSANKVLKFSDKERLWPGKLTAFYLPERRDFTAMKRSLMPDNSDKRATSFARVRGNEPFILVGVDAGVKQTDAEIVAEMGETVAEAMLDHKSGVNPGTFDLPNWIRNGFGKAMVLRAEGNSAKFTAHRTKVKALFVKANLPKFKASDTWGGMSNKDTETLTISLMEFFIYGMEAGKFDRLIVGLKPNEQGNLPSIDQALDGLELKPDALDMAWKAWVAKQK